MAFKNSKKQLGRVSVLLILLISSVLVAGSAGVVKAANVAKPGDALYPIDTGIENARLALATSSASKVKIRTQIAAERLTEAQQLLQEQGPDSPGIDVALANLQEQKKQIATLIAQNKELQTKVSELENKLQVKETQNTLNSTFDTVKKDLNTQLDEAEKKGDTNETEKLKDQIKDIENKKDAFDKEGKLEQSETVEPTEITEPKEKVEKSESENSGEKSKDKESSKSENSEKSGD